MKRSVVGATAASLVCASLLAAHDLFIKLDTYFLEPNTAVTVQVLNGTFGKSENWITRDRVADISVVSPGGRAHVDTTHWSPSTDSLTSLLAIRTGGPGTYVLGASTRARDLHLEAESFNEYLRLDGIPDVLAARTRDGELGKPAWERYAKHVKALVQVGDARTDHYTTILGYPAEIVPLANPYTLSADGTMRIRALVNGQPVANQLVIAGGESRDGTIAEQEMRTGADGTVSFPLTAAGRWYIKFINMVRVTGEEELDYVSQWATLTFEIR
jgi:hypothetical protein